MKKLQSIALFFLAITVVIFLFSFQNNTQYMLNFNNGDYDSAWKTIDSLERQGLPKSALEKTLELFEYAKRDENPAQIIKCLIYRGKYESQLEEDGLVKAIFKWEKEIEEADFPVKPILQSMLAEIYAGYLNNNRWRFQNRTQTTEWKADDIQTWTIEQLIEKSGDLYMASIENEAIQKVKLEDLKVILNNGLNTDGLRPTLYDFLAHRAIDYFMNAQSHLTQPAYKFYIDNAEYFKPAKAFVSLEIKSKDEDSYKYKTLLIFQKLLKIRLESDNVAALADSEIKLWKFLYDHSVSETKANDYEKILEWATENYVAHPVSSEFFFQLANLQFQRGQNYQPNPDEVGKWFWKQALEICEKGIKQYSNSFGASQCKSLQNQILRKSLNIQTEQINLPNSPFLALIEYRNVPNVYVKVVRMNEKRLEKLKEKGRGRDADVQIVDYLNSLPSSQNSIFDLPDDGDYRKHSVEVKIDALPFGKYAVLISDNQEFNIKTGSVGYVNTTISNLGYWHRTDDQNRNEYVVYNRQDGTPQEGVDVAFWSRNYNSIIRKNEFKKIAECKSENGGFLMPNFNSKNSFKVVLKKGKDTLDLDQWFYTNRNQYTPQAFQTMHFFLDRAIYRPGQTVFFKGILIEKDPKGMPKIISNKRVKLIFRDANYQELEQLDLTTNEYGTVNGTFVTPRSGLLGQMTIQVNLGSNSSAKSFRVEEYKRPKFEVGFEPIEGSYRIDSDVLVNGFAKAYAGNNIDGAKVSYRVVREVRFPWLPWWYFRGGYNPWSSESMEISNGTTKTDSEGKFNVEFKALPDRSIPLDKKPEFRYTIYADVIDITGETHSSKTTLRVGTVALDVTIQYPKLASVTELDSIQIETKNLSGTFEATTGSLMIELLKAPKQTFVKRFWQKPDKSLLNQTIFNKAFPHFAFKDEDESQNWNVQKLVHAIDFDTEKSNSIDLSYLDFEPGKYVFTITTEDQFGTPVEVKREFDLYDLNDKTLPVPVIGWHMIKKSTLQPGEQAEIYFGTSEKSLPILFELEKNGKVESRKWLTVQDLKKEVIEVSEVDRGNIHYHFSYAQHNRNFNNASTITVPWTNKELTIEYGTFRDKLLPSEDEEWVIKIKGSKGEKVAAEMVAGMYDASLDAFAANNWGMNLFPTSYPQRGLRARGYASNRGIFYMRGWRRSNVGAVGARSYEKLNWFNFNFYSYAYRTEVLSYESVNMRSDRMLSAPAMAGAEPRARKEAAVMDMATEEAGIIASGAALKNQSNATNYDNDPSLDDDGNSNLDISNIKVRTNLNETVFFFPNLMTDEEGNLVIKFKMNEALTKWKFLGLAHTQDLKIGSTTKEIVTQKELMIIPNPPRFFRENDEIEFTAKVVNLSDRQLSGEAALNLNNAMTGNPVFGDNSLVNRSFEIEAGQSFPLSWRFKVPDVSDVPMIEHTVFAQAGDFSDAEKSAAPVLSNRMLVTETKPLPIRGNETKVFTFERLKNNNSNTLKHHGLTLEFTQNPAWYAVQALPYLMEYPYECTEQIFSRFYANSLATTVANSHPKIKSVFEKWRDYQPESLKSNLSKNQELKTALLEETPWVLAAQSEELQKKNIGLLFDLNRMSYEQEIALAKLTERQLPNGGWAWFPGGRDSWYITQYIVEGMGHLDKLGVKSVTGDQQIWSVVQNAVRYCDARMVEKYEDLEQQVKEGKTTFEKDHLDNIVIHYLYARSFFLEDQSARAGIKDAPEDLGINYIQLEGKVKKVFEYYLGQAEDFWLSKGMYQEGMISLALHRMAKGETAAKMVRSFKERSLNNEELGMYWKYQTGYYWYQLPIETHALMIEVFEEVANDAKAVDDLKVWLLKNKQTNHWKTTKGTSAAVYALLMNGDNWLVEDTVLDIDFPASSNSKWKDQIEEAQKNADVGTGYFKTNIDGSDVSQGMASIRVENPNNHPSWGAVYWQYFEQLDKIKTFEETPLTLKKQLFKVENSPTGEIMNPISENAPLKPGDKIHVRIELRVDRSMEYVHMKDMRASGFEPINVMSQYKWQAGLGYYQSTKDASTNFFFSRLPKGTHVFEYPLRVVHKGDFSNGVTTIQCMYAPEFTSHSEGIRVEVN
ncbi:MAG: MG2 domain-containing protein [Bacteroidetes bacterium]|nr:MG2 domain-containing protein [Bacteroidota bacterium]